LSSPPETNLPPPPGEGPQCQYHCRALWQCFRSQRWKTGEQSISCQNAPDCTKLRLKFQHFPGGDNPGPPSLGRGPRGTPPLHTPPTLGASRLDLWPSATRSSPLTLFHTPPETNGWIKPWEGRPCPYPSCADAFGVSISTRCLRRLSS